MQRRQRRRRRQRQQRQRRRLYYRNTFKPLLHEIGRKSCRDARQDIKTALLCHDGIHKSNNDVNIIKKGNYTAGYGRDCGCGGLGYGAFVGAMAMQGIMAYYYDIIQPNTAVELNQCCYNWMGMDVRYRAHPSFNKHHPKVGQCRNNGDYCEDCRKTPVDQIHNVHYTQCRKPWNCILVGYPGGHYPKQGKASAIDTNAGDLDACLVMICKWHKLQSYLERKWYNVTKDELLLQGQSSNYQRDLFQGHCCDDGGANYLPIQASPESFSQLSKLYQ